jgi:hypothetical protein
MSACAVIAPREPLRDEGTLGELIAALWNELKTHHRVACPVCGAEMRPEYSAHAQPIGGRCATCGTSLH